MHILSVRTKAVSDSRSDPVPHPKLRKLVNIFTHFAKPSTQRHMPSFGLRCTKMRLAAGCRVMSTGLVDRFFTHLVCHQRLYLTTNTKFLITIIRKLRLNDSFFVYKNNQLYLYLNNKNLAWNASVTDKSENHFAVTFTKSEKPSYAKRPFWDVRTQ